ncbi:MAG: phosphoglycerate mutase (2,3-diphosphoglycerate-independent) [Candidatus Magasanikbacteria bacterium RIFOXYD2_FULL_41_14]|uniref:2,3-bisphosphoglycerate-independent phosphoglycerate mutase n=1 Tax=Candidatus Magasanikbacteria bacterium RIFOXYD2_FULL_41_14 TaxID=1798709 RepID=A0A1F6PE18_9BACT|nr:MAG: phosphoglycerate mutase (2,3-diphosphoglycerate-independent) [Candidatus Magasanikbacteria bacterium RIFOXYD2_FULL_41_14]
MDRSPVALIILDGFGLGKVDDPGNAITPTTAPNIFSYFKKYAHSTLKTYGQYAGLFIGQVGNSEAGHLNIGAGRIVKQDLVIISEAIHNGTFFKNTAFKDALFHTKKHNSAVHLMGLLTDGNSAHAYPEHLYALLELCRDFGQKKVYLHLFTDGRDSSPHSALQFLRVLRTHMLENEKVATIMGRFYGMDRNKIWSRTKMAYEAITAGKGNFAKSAEEALSQAYNRGETDEYVMPTIITKSGKPIATIQDNDAVIFFNARSDRAREITKSLVQEDFTQKNPGSFNRRHNPKNLRFVALTDFGPDLPGVLTAFPSSDIKNCLPLAVGEKYRQLYISETEKFAHVTYFINGGFADPLDGEERELVKSEPVRSYADKPEMSCRLISRKICNYLKKDKYNFIVVNFPNADMVGHTGNLDAAKKAVKIMDTEVGRVVEMILKKNGVALITADHGNADVMINFDTKEMMTEHTENSVPCILISKKCMLKRLKNGILADVAPTLLKIMGIKKPKEMTGKSLC